MTPAKSLILRRPRRDVSQTTVRRALNGPLSGQVEGPAGAVRRTLSGPFDRLRALANTRGRPIAVRARGIRDSMTPQPRETGLRSYKPGVKSHVGPAVSHQAQQNPESGSTEFSKAFHPVSVGNSIGTP